VDLASNFSLSGSDRPSRSSTSRSRSALRTGERMYHKVVFPCMFKKVFSVAVKSGSIARFFVGQRPNTSCQALHPTPIFTFLFLLDDERQLYVDKNSDLSAGDEKTFLHSIRIPVSVIA
jgi:hypothetical protein